MSPPKNGRPPTQCHCRNKSEFPVNGNCTVENDVQTNVQIPPKKIQKNIFTLVRLGLIGSSAIQQYLFAYTGTRAHKYDVQLHIPGPNEPEKLYK